MLDLAELQVQLKAVTDIPVELVADVQAAQQHALVPGIMLCHGRNTVSHAEMHPITRHKVTAEILLISVLERGNSGLAGDVRDELTTLRQPLLKKLVGFIPNSADSDITWHGGQLLTVTNEALFWVDILKTDYWFN